MGVQWYRGRKRGRLLLFIAVMMAPSSCQRSSAAARTVVGRTLGLFLRSVPEAVVGKDDEIAVTVSYEFAVFVDFP
jgi:hypothetical protein